MEMSTPVLSHGSVPSLCSSGYVSEVSTPRRVFHSSTMGALSTNPSSHASCESFRSFSHNMWLDCPDSNYITISMDRIPVDTSAPSTPLSLQSYNSQSYEDIVLHDSLFNGCENVFSVNPLPPSPKRTKRVISYGNQSSRFLSPHYICNKQPAATSSQKYNCLQQMCNSASSTMERTNRLAILTAIRAWASIDKTI